MRTILLIPFIYLLNTSTPACEPPPLSNGPHSPASKPHSSTGETRLSIQVNGMARTALLYQPSGGNASLSLPLVIALHGNLGTGRGMEKLTGFEPIADKELFMLIYPDGIKRSWNDGRDTKAHEMNVDDVAFIRQLIDEAISKYKADPKRIYVTGMSNGGFMTMRLACELADKIAAVAPVAASMDADQPDRCRPTHAMPVILIQGNSDPLVPFEGGSVKSKAGGPILSHQGTIDYWVKTDHCLPTPAITKIPDNAQDGTTVSYSLYSGGDDGAEVAGYVIEDGGHTWPGGWQYLPKMLVGRTTRNLDASRIIWEFFKKHPKAG